MPRTRLYSAALRTMQVELTSCGLVRTNVAKSLDEELSDSLSTRTASFGRCEGGLTRSCNGCASGNDVVQDKQGMLGRACLGTPGRGVRQSIVSYCL